MDRRRKFKAFERSESKENKTMRIKSIVRLDKKESLLTNDNWLDLSSIRQQRNPLERKSTRFFILSSEKQK